MTESLWDWSRTAATNASADAGINWAEGMSPAAINNSARGMMAAIAKYLYDVSGQIVTTGTSTAYVATTTSGLGSLAEGRMLCVEIDETCGATPTINVDTLGAKKLYRTSSSGMVQIAASELQIGGRYILQYDTSLDTAAGGWIVLNPTALTSSIGTTDIANDAVTYAKMQNVVTNQRVLGRTSGAGGDVEEVAISAVLDWIGSTRGAILYRGASGWAILSPGATSGHVLKSNGTGADPSYAAVTLPTGTIVDRAFASYAAVTLITGITPWDDTIPAVSEGTEILSASITPKSTTNRIRIRAHVFGARASGGDLSHSMHAHVNGGAAIVAVGMSLYDNAATLWPGVLEWEYVPGSVSAQTITIRVGSATSTGFYLNGNSTGRKYGGVGACTLVLEEIVA